MSNLNSILHKIESASAIPVANAWVPQFTSARYGKTSSTRCRSCNNQLHGHYFIVNRQKVCLDCAELARQGLPVVRPGSWMNALVLGIGGAILGMIFYSAFTFATGLTIGYLAVAVGWLVGTAIMAGTDSVGGRPLQYLAVLLTYIAISLSELPILLYSAYAHPDPTSNLGTLLLQAIVNGLLSPFQRFNGNLLSAILNLVILVLGLRIAWRITRARRFTVAGPFGTE